MRTATHLLQLALLLPAIGHLSIVAGHELPARRLMDLQQKVDNGSPGSSASNPRKLVLDVTVGTQSPDCREAARSS